MPLTAKVVDICDYLLNLLADNQASLGIEGLAYGDVERLPVTPYVCVEPEDKTRTLKNAQRMTNLNFTIFIIVYFGPVASVQANRRGADILAESIEDLVHSKKSLDGLVTHGMITNIASGYANRDRTLIRASRMTYEGISQELLTSAPG